MRDSSGNYMSYCALSVLIRMRVLHLPLTVINVSIVNDHLMPTVPPFGEY